MPPSPDRAETFLAIDPTTGEEIERHDPTPSAEVEAALEAGVEAQAAWEGRTFDERARVLRTAAGILRDRSREWGELMTREMGKPVEQGVSEAEKCAWVCEYYAEHGEAFLAAEEVETDASRSYWTYRPLGLVLAVMPWNFPLWQVFRFAAPGLMAGNGALLKHAPNVPGCARACESILREAGAPEGLFRSLYLGTEATGELMEDPRIRAVTLTGSVAAGKVVAGRAGSLVKKTVLELGGSDPYVVLADADVEAAAEACVTSRLINSGQSCIAAKRLIVVREVAEAFTDAVLERMGEVEPGDPMEEGTRLGPMAREDLRDDLHDQVRRSVDAGATLALGGEVPDRAGWWYPATVLTGVREGMPAYEEELFGPVAAILVAEDEDDAIRIANDTPFGLGAAVFTADVERGERIAAERLHAGACFVNAFVRSDPRLPFGGIKESGYGRELSPLGIREFVNIKTVWVA